MATSISGSDGITTQSLELDTPLAEAEGGTGLTSNPLGVQFTSAEQTITASGSASMAHGLGNIPSLVQLRVICKVADQGYSIGDEVFVPMASADPATHSGVGVLVDASNITVRYASGSVFLLPHKTTGSVSYITNSSWKLIVRAWK